ncbi:unnamed protein product [Peronospora farinosa]|uniref:TOG domain-containing protein n=1 Tax=Peronospora farinosa TaxID=134698 RepID=A0AAV0U8I5_9STRA|nr:unnamed protein product [Peronospora farinosa]CAI5733121.1 unnamed protein product [Peronospora farinosa]
MEDMALLLGSSATKQRLAGVTGLLEQLRKQNAVPEVSAMLFSHVLPCLRDHNSKIALGALEVLQLLVARVSENTLRSSFKLLWSSLMERLGDNKLHIREKAVDVVVEISVVLDVLIVLEKLQLCMKHKNWRTREQSLHAVWRCLEEHKLFKERQDELLKDVLKLLEDSSKDVRDAAMVTLEKFYTYIGPSFLSDLQDKVIRAGHMATLEKRFDRIPLCGQNLDSVASAVSSHDVVSKFKGASAPNSGVTDALSSMLSSYDLQATSSSSSSVARYLESVRHRTLKEAKDAAVSAGRERSPSQESSESSTIVQATKSFGANSDNMADKEIQKQVGVIFDKLQLDNEWDKRVDGLKMLQKLTNRCTKASNSEAAITSLSQALRPIRERLCEQVTDLRSSVSREACETIQTLAKTLRDEFNAHAEICLGNLLKATYVTIQVISTAADTTIRTMIKSTSNGYTRVIPKLIECAKSRNHVLRYNAVCYLTLTLQQWSISVLSKHSDLFVPIMPAILRDALGDVRAQSRKCYWSFHYLFPNEAESVFARLDGSTQKNLKDDSSKFTAKTARQTDYTLLDTPVSQSGDVELSALRSTNAPQPPISAPAAFFSVTSSNDEQHDIASEESAAGKQPRRIFGGSSSELEVDAAEKGTKTSRMLTQGPMRIGLAAKSSASKGGSVSTNEAKKSAATGPLRVRYAPNSLQPTNEAVESMYASRQESSTAEFHTSLKQVSKVQRVQRAVEAQAPASMDIDASEVAGPKRFPIASMPSPTASNVSSPRPNVSSRGDSGDNKLKRVAPIKSFERPKVAPLLVADQLEEALRNIESTSWSNRLEAAKYIGKLLQKRDEQTTSGTSGDRKVDHRILMAFMKHLSDAHYRVSQCVLKNFLPLLKLFNDNQILIPHLKTILSKLFQKFIDTKESVRVVAKENLEHIASTFDSSTLAATVISILGDGSNMKVKAAMCHYLRDLLPKAEGYMSNGANNSHMRSFLLKIALLMDADVPVSVSSACGELVSVSAQHYGPEMEAALGLLPPSKRLVVAKVLQSKRIGLNNSNSQKPPLSSAPRPSQLQNVDNDNQSTTKHLASKVERSRKRPESPNVDLFSSSRQSSQKRINTTFQSTTEDQMIDAQTISPAGTRQVSEVVVNTSLPERISLFSELRPSGGACVDKCGTQLEDILCILEQQNLSEAEMKHALYETLHFIKTGSSDTWDRCFGRLLLLLLDAATGKNVSALKVLQKLVVAQPSRAQLFFELLLQRLIDAMGNESDVAGHLIERILHNVVSTADDKQQSLATLIPLLSSREPPALQVVLRLIKVCLQQCERNSFEDVTFLRKDDMVDQTLSVLAKCLNHSSSNVRKNAVDCLVAFHFAVMEDGPIVPTFLATKVDDTQQRLVEIFIDRAKMERHHIGRLSIDRPT